MGKRVPLSIPHMSGEEAHLVVEAIESGFVTPLGPMVDLFEQEFCEYVDIPYCCAVATGSAAVHLALHHIGIGPGDEVLAPSFTFIATVSPAVQLGGRVTFVDSDAASWNIDPELVEEILARRAQEGQVPRAVIAVDLFGQPCSLSRIQEICGKYGIPVVCDSAEALGAWYVDGNGKRLRHAGAGAAATVFSFNGNKVITTSCGGMIASEDPDLIAHVRKLASQAREPVLHYEHREIGYNYRMSNILAAIGRGQLRVLDERVRRRREIFTLYRRLLQGIASISFMPEAAGVSHSRWLTVILVDPVAFGVDCRTVLDALLAETIEARPVWKPLHMQPVFRECEVVGGGVCESLFARGICLPSGSTLSNEDVLRVCNEIRRVGGYPSCEEDGVETAGAAPSVRVMKAAGATSI